MATDSKPLTPGYAFLAMGIAAAAALAAVVLFVNPALEKGREKTVGLLEDRHGVEISDYHLPFDEYGSWTVDGIRRICLVEGEGNDRALLCTTDLLPLDEVKP